MSMKPKHAAWPATGLPPNGFVWENPFEDKRKHHFGQLFDHLGREVYSKGEIQLPRVHQKVIKSAVEHQEKNWIQAEFLKPNCHEVWSDAEADYYHYQDKLADHYEDWMWEKWYASSINHEKPLERSDGRQIILRVTKGARAKPDQSKVYRWTRGWSLIITETVHMFPADWRGKIFRPGRTTSAVRWHGWYGRFEELEAAHRRAHVKFFMRMLPGLDCEDEL